MSACSDQEADTFNNEELRLSFKRRDARQDAGKQGGAISYGNIELLKDKERNVFYLHQLSTEEPGKVCRWKDGRNLLWMAENLQWRAWKLLLFRWISGDHDSCASTPQP
jgi:hypothetical protein